ncbi:MAG: DUF1015 family protein [Bacteroidota bacterium]
MRIQAVRLQYPLLERLPSVEQYFSNAKEKYIDYRQKKVLQKIEHPAVFVYQIEKKDGKQYNGIVASIDMQDHADGKIKGHEDTLVAKELQQLQLLEERQAQVKPVLLTYPKVDGIEQWITAVKQSHRLFLEVAVGKNTHRLWRVDGKDAILHVQLLFKEQVARTYIADGHHRTAVMARWQAGHQEKAYLYCTLFSSDQIEILPFNRVVDGVEKRSLEAFIKEIKNLCDIRKINTPFIHPPKHCLQMYVQKQWYALIWRPDVLNSCENAVEQLDPYLLDQRILRKVMQIQNIRESDQVKYIGGLEASVRKMMLNVDKKKDRIGFYLPAVSMKDFLTVVNAGHLLPPKSTWFEPRMLNGLLVHEV